MIRFKPLITIFALVLGMPSAICSTTTHETSSIDTKWISIYLGKETRFQPELFKKLQEICDAYGVPYQVTSEKKLLVPLKSRSHVLNLISLHYRK